MARRSVSPLELDTFFETAKSPEAYEPSLQSIRAFIKEHDEAGRRVVVITSGGTIVPLERQMVRFLDNFSAGTRGAISADFAPFSRKFRAKDESILNYLEKDGDSVQVCSSIREKISETYGEYIKYKEELGRLLMVPFYTVADYLYLLMELSKECRGMGNRVMVYLAAAVSDFYLPEKSISEHKIQSDEGTLTLKLEPVPKLIHYIVALWAPKAFIVTFKLETDPSLLLTKSLMALENYGHQVVIGNILKDRKREVTFVERSGIISAVSVADPDNEEIEEKIVDHLVELHTTSLSAA